MGMEASEHRVDLAVVSRMESGTDGVRAIAAIRDALRAAELEMEGLAVRAARSGVCRHA